MFEAYFGFRLLLIALIIVLNAFFAMAEVSLVSARRSRLHQLADSGNVGAIAALSLLKSPEKLLSVIQVGLTLASLALGWAGEETLSHFFFNMLHPILPVLPAGADAIVHGLSFALGFILMSYLHVLIGEVVPKNLALDSADRLAVIVAPILLLISRTFRPLIYVIEQSASVISRLFGLRATAHAGGHTAEELNFLVQALREGGEIDEFEESSITRLTSLHLYSAREIMTPRNKVVSVPLDSTLDDLLRTMIDHQYSRVPVYDQEPEKIVGVVHYKDLLRVWEDRRQSLSRRLPTRPFRLEQILRKALVVPETKPLHQLLEEFRRSPQHIAAVVDEFGTVSGIVTMEDVLEQVFGEIEDEHDEPLALPPLEANEVEVEGTVPIADLDSLYDLRIPTDAGFETLAGFIMFKLGRLPHQGEFVEHDNLRFTVLELDHHRIARVKIEKLPEEEQPAPEVLLA